MFRLVKNELKKMWHLKTIIYCSLGLVLFLFAFISAMNRYEFDSASDDFDTINTNYNFLFDEIATKRLVVEAGIGNTTLESDYLKYINYYTYKEELTLLDSLDKKYKKQFLHDREEFSDVACYVEAKILEDTENYNKCKTRVDKVYNDIKNGDYGVVIDYKTRDVAKRKEEIEKEFDKNLNWERQDELKKELSFLRSLEEDNELYKKYITDIDDENQYAKYELIRKYSESKIALIETKNLTDQAKQEYKADAGTYKYLIENEEITLKQRLYNDSMINHMQKASGLVITMVLLVICTSISLEFSKGTIKQLLVKPFNRNKILLSKMISAFIILLIFGVLQYFTVSFTISSFADVDFFSNIYVYDTTTESIKIFTTYGFFIKCFICALPEYILAILFATCVSVITKNEAISFGLSLGSILAIEGLKGVFELVPQLTPYAKYVVLLIMDMNPFQFGGYHNFAGRDFTLAFSLVMLFILILGLITFKIFQKTDIKNQ